MATWSPGFTPRLLTSPAASLVLESSSSAQVRPRPSNQVASRSGCRRAHQRQISATVLMPPMVRPTPTFPGKCPRNGRPDPTFPGKSRTFGWLALRVLRSLAGPLQAGLLALLLARVAGEEAGLLEDRAELRVALQQRPGQAVGDRAGLAGLAAADDLDAGVVALGVGHPEGRHHHQLERPPPQV